MEDMKELFKDIINKYETYEECIKVLRSMESENEISNDEYNYLIGNWNRLLKECE